MKIINKNGGIGAELSGGNFWQGAVTGGIVAGLNSAMHKLGDENKNSKKGPPYEYNGNKYNTKEELYKAILIHQASEQFGIADIISLGAVIDNQGLLNKRFQMKRASKGTSVASKYGSKFLPIKTMALPTHFGKNFTLMLTTNLGRFAGRMAGPVGWYILAYDTIKVLSETQIKYDNIVYGKK